MAHPAAPTGTTPDVVADDIQRVVNTLNLIDDLPADWLDDFALALYEAAYKLQLRAAATRRTSGGVQ